MKRLLLFFFAILTAFSFAGDASGNRLVYLDENDPYYVSLNFPKLVTPQWIGEEGIDAAIILSIDDLRDPPKYEAFLRPILTRLKEIDGRAPLSIFCNRTDTAHPLFQTWLKEGVSLENHTLTHPFPMLNSNSMSKSKRDYDGGIDQLLEIPGNHPVAFRTPNCDGRNTLSPRFFTEMFNKTTEKGNFLSIDSSVFNFPTANDAELPKKIVTDADGRDRFLKFIPTEVLVNSIFDYPYPYVIGRLCWEFPCMAPSDYEAQVQNGVCSPKTLNDMSAGLDAAVAKKGVFTICFHPHGWIKNMQIVELIDRAVAKHGKKIKFLTFKEAQERIDKNLLKGQPLRNAKGQDNGVRLLDLDNDGYLDVVIGNDKTKLTRVWDSKANAWQEFELPTPLVNGDGAELGVRFGILRGDGLASLIQRDEKTSLAYEFANDHWADVGALSGEDAKQIFTIQNSRDRGVRLRDLDGDGICEMIVSNDTQNLVLKWSEQDRAWTKLPFALPAGTSIVDADGADNGLRFVDLNGDGFADIVFSNEARYSVHLFTSMKDGWSNEITKAVRTATAPYWDLRASAEVPMIARGGTSNGVWFHSKFMNVQNENVTFDRISFADLAMGVQNARTPHPPPQPPADAKQTLKLHPGFSAEIVAQEPMLQDPIAFDWGPDGRLWVVEMSDYPLGVDGKGKPGGRVKCLESTKGDGKYDKCTTFLDNLNFPTGVTVWKKGVLVFSPPDLLYAEDTKGDGVADKREVLFTGFKEGNPQHRANGLVRGLDNWLYGANGDSGGVVKSLKTGKSVDIGARDFRLKPDEGLFETVAGRTQYGRVCDDWGHWFGSMNSAPPYHYPIEERYLKRNPHAVVTKTAATFGDHPLFPTNTGIPGFNFTRRFTSACSPAIYRDDLFGAEYATSIFESEPAHNLVHREVLSLQGSAYTSERAADEPDFDFVASSDVWFRPATVKVGPDGALWIADMYRYVIEHPQWILKTTQNRVDLRAGSDRGRLYRIYPANKRPRAIPRLDTLDGPALAAMLDSPSGWQRDLVQEMIVQRQQKELAPQLEKLALENAHPQCRLHALCTLDGLGALTPAVVLKALSDMHAGVRMNALRLSEQFVVPPLGGTALEDQTPAGRLKAGLRTQLAEAILAFPEDPNDDTLNLQLACTLGELDDARAGERLSQLALKHNGDVYFVSAVLSSLNKSNYAQTLSAALKTGDSQFIGKLASLAPHLAGEKTFASLFLQIAAAPNNIDALGALLDGSAVPLAKLVPNDPAVRIALAAVWEKARAAATKADADPAERLRALKILGRDESSRETDIAIITGLLKPQYDVETQSAAVNALIALNDPKVGEILLAGWRSYGAALRSQVAQAMFRRETWLIAELKMLEEKKILPHELDASQRARMLWDTRPAIKERVDKIFAGAVNRDRQKVVDAYKPALGLQGAAESGAKIFTEKCSICHHLGTVGTAVGPNLDALADNSPEALMIAILDPNRAIEPRYISYTLATTDGQRFTGLIDAETPTSVVLLEQGGKRQTIARDQIKALASSGISLMPEGLETGISAQDLANLIAHVRSFRPAPPRRVFGGNLPETIKPDAKGVLLLPASACEIFGRTIAFETEHSNLGYWSNNEDYAEWTVDVPRAGKYEVTLDYACMKDSAGNLYTIRAGLNELAGKVAGTGTWEDYQQAKAGEIAVDAGKQKISFRAGGPIKQSLIDLRALKLTPVK
ncbi:MAG TPA: PVC-type heme-binding CxxCH protein [Planctomycetota bacterium]|nr:PVC-type heme-binding CxxCH protein [Planctomycetota bacterium]